MEEFKKCQCGPISPSPGQNIRLRHIQISVGFLITLAIRAQLSVKVLRILAWFLDKMTHFREETYKQKINSPTGTNTQSTTHKNKTEC